MRTYYVYRATNKVNGMIYIGITSNFKERKWQHERCYEKEDCLFHRAIQKYGKNNFQWDMIDATVGLENACKLEKRYIKQFNSYKNGNGYNMTKGGDGGSMWNARAVVCLTLDGNFVKRYDSAGEAKKDGFHDSDVLISCKNSIRTVKNYIFMFEDNYLNNGARKYMKPESTSKKEIIQCDLQGRYLATFKSVKDAAKTTGTCRTTISGVLTGHYKSANNYIFVYKENFPIKNISDYQINKKGKKVAQIELKTNKIINVYNSVADAGRALNVNYKSIHKVIDMTNRTAYGYKWISQ